VVSLSQSSCSHVAFPEEMKESTSEFLFNKIDVIGQTFFKAEPLVTQIVFSGLVNLLHGYVPFGHFFVVGFGLMASIKEGPLALPQTRFP